MPITAEQLPQLKYAVTNLKSMSAYDACAALSIMHASDLPSLCKIATEAINLYRARIKTVAWFSNKEAEMLYYAFRNCQTLQQVHDTFNTPVELNIQTTTTLDRIEELILKIVEELTIPSTAMEEISAVEATLRTTAVCEVSVVMLDALQNGMTEERMKGTLEMLEKTVPGINNVNMETILPLFRAFAKK